MSYVKDGKGFALTVDSVFAIMAATVLLGILFNIGSSSIVLSGTVYDTFGKDVATIVCEKGVSYASSLFTKEGLCGSVAYMNETEDYCSCHGSEDYKVYKYACAQPPLHAQIPDTTVPDNTYVIVGWCRI